MAYYGSLGDIDVGAISSTKSETAVDVFVYDTRKDSDGGAWRKRTQHTSWYNETLNTATRGGRREFPAVAVIVATQSTVTIYDGDDPDMPMWMVFNGTAAWNQGLYYSGGGSRCISALNGVISWGDNVGAFGLVTVNFINEFCVARTNNSTYGGFSNIPLINRNSTTASTFAANTYTHTAGTIASVIVNDVAMTVLPNAPIDSSTGLPVPTIAVATAGGTSIIRDDGTVADIYYGNFNVANFVHFTKDNKIATFTDSATGGARFYRIYEIPSSDLNGGAYNNMGVALRAYSGDAVAYNYPIRYFWYSNNIDVGNFYANALVYAKDGPVFGRNGRGIALIAEATNPVTGTVNGNLSTNDGMVCGISSSANTGWMHGDIKGAWLSDTSTASVTGTELVTNGNFSGSDLSSYFQVNNCSLAVVSNQLVMTSNTGNYYCEFYVSIADTSKPHYLSFQFVGASNLSQFGVYASPATGYVTDTQAGWSNPSYVTDRNTGVYTILIPAGNSMVGFVFPSPAVYTWTFDNISLKPVQESDRSVNNRGLAVYGTITKTPVATGSNLVAYGNFSAGNYLFQPYNSALDFGTGDFCYMCWVKDDSVSTGAVIFQRGAAVNGNETVLYISSDMRLIGRVQTNSGVTSNICFIEGQWNFIVFQRRGSTIEIYHNGILQGSTTNTETTTQVGQGLSIGAWLTNNSYFPTSISLFRVSATAPSSEQIRKIYNDEKALFQPNSQCTLFGSSDAVTALAYDDTTNLLHVGTASGRSEFKGLRRIGNTTTAVTTAISASNGLVAEQ